MNLPPMITKATMLLSKNSPAVLTSLGVVGVLTTAVLAVKATPRALTLIDEYVELEAERRELDVSEIKVEPIDIVKLCWREYIPAVSMGALSIACIIGSHGIHTQRNAALISAYSLAEKSLTDYRTATEELVTTDKAGKIQALADQKSADASNSFDGQLLITNEGEQLCYDTYSGRYFKSDIETVRKAMNDVNEIINNNSYASLNEFGERIGLGPTTGGSEVGWTIGNTMDLTFSTILSPENKPAIAIGYRRLPKPKYDRLGEF